MKHMEKCIFETNTDLVWEHSRSWFLRGLKIWISVQTLLWLALIIFSIHIKCFGFLTQKVEFCREGQCIAIRDKGIIPSVWRLHFINRQFVGPGDTLRDVTKETTLIVTHNYARDSCPGNILLGNGERSAGITFNFWSPCQGKPERCQGKQPSQVQCPLCHNLLA